MVFQVHMHNFLVTKVNIHHAILWSRAQGDVLPVKSLREGVLPIEIADLASLLHFPYLVSRAVLNRSQGLLEAPRTRRISTRRCRHLQGFMGPLKIIHLPPTLKALLARFQVQTHAV